VQRSKVKEGAEVVQRSADVQVKVQRFSTVDYAGGAKVLQRFTRGGSEFRGSAEIQRCGAGAKVQIWRCNKADLEHAEMLRSRGAEVQKCRDVINMELLRC